MSRLNDAERRVLRLLGEGHTAKSIASTIGSTPAAVNERLREARRKTGAGSSRELARMMRAQENRDDEIGVARPGPSGSAVFPASARNWREQRGVIAMIALLVAAAAGGAALMSQASPSNKEIDPLIGRLERFPQPADLHGRLRAESRDFGWAPAMEDSIHARLMSMPLIGKGPNVLRVTCERTLCELAGTLIAPSSKAELEDQKSQFNRTIQDLQVPPLTDDLARLGLKNEGASFLSGLGKPDRTIFLLYYSRVEHKPK